MNFIIYNSKIQADSVLLTTNNRAFKYGDGLFETIWYSKGAIPFIKEHLQRLNRGMQVLGYNTCDCLAEDNLRAMITELCIKNEIDGAARVRLSVYRKDGGLYSPETDDFDFIIETSPLNHHNYKLSTKGLLIGVAKSVQKPINILSEIKTTNALLMVLAAREAKSKNWDDSILLNTNGTIAETTSSNVFIVQEKIIYTPPIEDGAMDGIMRNQIAYLVKNSSYQLRVKSLTISDLESADEIFLTNAIKGIMWVVGYDKKRFFNKASRELTTLLNEHIQDLSISNSDS